MFGVEISAVNDGFGGAASFFELELLGVDGVFEGSEEGLFDFLKEEGKRPADDDGFWRFLIDDVDKAE